MTSYELPESQADFKPTQQTDEIFPTLRVKRSPDYETAVPLRGYGLSGFLADLDDLIHHVTWNGTPGLYPALIQLGIKCSPADSTESGKIEGTLIMKVWLEEVPDLE